MKIRLAKEEDRCAVLEVLEPVIRAGDTYALPIDMTANEILSYWFSSEKKTYVAEDEGEILGTYYMRPNQLGGGSHVCNCGYITSQKARGRGVARQMCKHSLKEALKIGYRAMQYNCVVSTNTIAIRLWEQLGFKIVGILPGAFHVQSKGDVDAFVMYQTLQQT